MDPQALLSEFLSSEHGQDMSSALAAQGLPQNQVGQVIQEVVGVAHGQLAEGGGGLLGGGGAQNLLASLAGGLTSGSGLAGSLKSGIEGMLSSRLSEVLANKVGIDASIVPRILAVVTPLLVKFLSSKQSA